MSKKLIGYLLVAVVAFAIGTQTKIPTKKIAATFRPADVAEDKSWGGRSDKPLLDNETGAAQYAETSKVGKYPGEKRFQSAYIGGELIIPSGVFMPGEAEAKVLPLMSAHADIFKGKTVLEIGAGSGPISIYAAKLGASRVVSTDISPEAVAAIRANADRLGVGDIVEARLVPPEDMSAYSVIQPDEKFDIIISNPPYALDLDAPVNTAAVDTGELGFSIVRGFADHLAPDGMALLFYDSLFYHQVIKKYARHEGYEVISHNPIGLYTWAAETLFNNYLERLLEKENLPKDMIRFERDKDGLNWVYLRNQCLDPKWAGYQKLIPGSDDDEYYPGWMSIVPGKS
jgi:predicted RNA methylase